MTKCIQSGCLESFLIQNLVTSTGLLKWILSLTTYLFDIVVADMMRQIVCETRWRAYCNFYYVPF